MFVFLPAQFSVIKYFHVDEEEDDDSAGFTYEFNDYFD